MTETPISDAVKQSITEAFRAVPSDKRGALLVLVTESGAKAMLAAKLNGTWKVAANAQVDWTGQVTGSVAIQGSW